MFDLVLPDGTAVDAVPFNHCDGCGACGLKAGQPVNGIRLCAFRESGGTEFNLCKGDDRPWSPAQIAAHLDFDLNVPLDPDDMRSDGGYVAPTRAFNWVSRVAAIRRFFTFADVELVKRAEPKCHHRPIARLTALFVPALALLWTVAVAPYNFKMGSVTITPNGPAQGDYTVLIDTTGEGLPDIIKTFKNHRLVKVERELEHHHGERIGYEYGDDGPVGNKFAQGETPVPTDELAPTTLRKGLEGRALAVVA